jgi:hypothetical protein
VAVVAGRQNLIAGKQNENGNPGAPSMSGPGTRIA